MHSTVQQPEEVQPLHQTPQQNNADLPHHAALKAASSVPRRRNRPANALARQERRRLRRLKYAETFSDLPSDLQDNEFITTGYRKELGVWESLQSIFGLHNETGNIWTHLIGTVCDTGTAFTYA